MITFPPFAVRRVYDHWEVTGPDGFITDVSDDAVAGSKHPSFAARDIGILRYVADYRVPSAETDQEIDDRRRADAYRAQDLGRFPC